MKVLLSKVKINDPRSSFNGQTVDILIESGIITAIQSNLSVTADQTISGEGMVVSPGWVDVFANFADPGYEFKETLESGANAAAAGGYTDVFVIPNTRPVIDTKAQVEYIKHKSASLPVTIHPIGAISQHADGQSLSEMYDMRNSGAVAFSDGTHPMQSAGILLKALQYVKSFEGVIIQIPDDRSVGANGLMHEGIVSTQLGLAGKPMMAEELLVARDIKLARYAGSSIHFTGVTSPKSLEYIRRAKEAGLQVTCSATPYHLFFTDAAVSSYDSNYKVYPPLRTATEIAALKKALTDGTIDCIATHHLPHETDSKVVEFEYASYGMIGLETCYAALRTVLPELPDHRWAELLSINPRKIFGLVPAGIEINQKAIVTIYQPNRPMEVISSGIRSRSRNTPFIGKKLDGSVTGIINGTHIVLNH